MWERIEEVFVEHYHFDARSGALRLGECNAHERKEVKRLEQLVSYLEVELGHTARFPQMGLLYESTRHRHLEAYKQRHGGHVPAQLHEAVKMLDEKDKEHHDK